MILNNWDSILRKDQTDLTFRLMYRLINLQFWSLLVKTSNWNLLNSRQIVDQVSNCRWVLFLCKMIPILWAAKIIYWYCDYSLSFSQSISIKPETVKYQVLSILIEGITRGGINPSLLYTEVFMTSVLVATCL